MKKVINYITLAATAMFCLVSCFQEKSEIPVYVPATAETNAQVFFKDVPTTQVKLAKESPSLDIIVARESTGALSVPITATGDDALTYFNVPASVDFAADEKEAKLTISAKDVANTPMNEYYKLTLSIADAALITAYGTSEFSFEIGISLPWIKFSDGLLVEAWWGEEEPGKVMYYQQLTPTLRYCKIDDCWGHDTGASYNVQPYIWYWNTETNACYVPEQYMGYSSGANDMYISDEPGFYNLWWNKSAPGKNGSGQVAGTDAWFAFCDAFRATYPEDYYPYYDGKGKFYLADYGFWMSGGVPTGSGAQFGGDMDMFICSFAADYTIGLEYQGLLTDKEGVVSAVVDVTYEGADAADVALVLVQGKDPNAAVDVLEPAEAPAEDADPGYIVISAAGTAKLPFAEDAEDGFYSIVAVPINGEGGFEWDYAVFETIVYGELDPLYLEYTSADLVAYVAKDKLLSTTWVAYSAAAGKTAADRTATAEVTFTDAEDNAAGDDLITCTGLLNVPFTMEYYQGIIYTLAAQELGTASGYDLVYSTYSDENFGGNYAMLAAYVADGIIAFVNNSKSDFFYGIALWGYQGGALKGAFKRHEYLLLVDPAILAEPAGAPKSIEDLVQVQVPYRNSVSGLRSNLMVAPKDWSKDVIASGKVLTYGGKDTKSFVEK
jgi:hypothetical protein